jgi:flavin-dependent dehydrogenase
MAPQLHVVIVGAGIAGLTCSIVLARYNNVSVTVLDRLPSVRQVCMAISRLIRLLLMSQEINTG